MLEFVCSIEQRVGFMHVFNGRDPAMTRMNDQELYRSPIFHIQHLLMSFLGSSKLQANGFNG